MKIMTKRLGHLRSLFSAVFLSWVGNWMTSLVIFGWVFQMTGSPAWMAAGIMCHRLPMLIGSIYFAPLAINRPAKLRSIVDYSRAIILGFMAVSVFYASRLSNHPIWIVVAFLFFASIRSFLSGADGPTEASIVSFEAQEDRKRAASNQQMMNIIVGASGLIASLLFTFGVLAINLVGVLVFDLCTFGFSGFVFRKLRNKDPSFPVENKRVSPFKMFKTSLKYPNVIFLTIGHCVRMFGVSVALQQWLLLLKVRFGMGPESSGYLYMAVTLAWFLSAQLVRMRRWQPSILLFLVLSSLLCGFAPTGWFIHSIVALVIFTFVYAFIDGALLATISGEFQLYVRDKHIAEIFGNLTVWTQVGVVGGSLLIGEAAKYFGYEKGAVLVGGAMALLLGSITLIFIILKPTLEWLWHVWRLRKNGFRSSQTFEVFNSIEQYLELPSGLTTQLIPITEATSTIKTHDRTLYSAAIVLNPSVGEHSHYLAMRLSIYEALERIGGIRYFEKNNIKPPLPASSGMAIQITPDLARKAAQNEVLERDSILAHYYFRKPPLLKLSAATLIRENINQKFLAAKTFDKCDFYGFVTADPDLLAWTCLTTIGHDFSLGWGISSVNSESGLIKALVEAIASFRFHKLNKLKALITFIKSDTEKTDTEEKLIQICKTLGVNFNDFQTAAVLCSPDSLDRLSFFNKAPECESFAKLKEFASKQKTWLTKLSIKTQDFEDDIFGNLVFASAHSDLAFTPTWPMVPKNKLEFIKKYRFPDLISLTYSDNINGPCLIY